MLLQGEDNLTNDSQMNVQVNKANY